MSKPITFPTEFTNSLGYPKKIVIYEPNAEGKYPVVLWEMLHGEFCGSGEMTREDLNAYLEHFGIPARI